MDEVKIDEGDELTAMKVIADALSPFEPKTRKRIVGWVSDKFELGQLPASMQPEPKGGTVMGDDSVIQGTALQDAATLFEKASPSTDAEKVLVVAYWMQEMNHESVTAVRVNKKLKDLGHRVDHINRVFTGLIEQKPSLVIQTHKSGKAKQGRKTYKVTTEGIKRVKAMLATGQVGPEE